MELTVTTNWAEDFLDRMAVFKEVRCIRGRLFKDEMGGLINPHNFFKHPTKKIFERNIKKAHSLNMEFSYALDSFCLENREYGWEGQKKILEFIKYIADSGADSVNIVIPHLIEVIKEQFPHLKVEFGSSIAIGEIKRIKYFQRLGADAIILRPDFNRNFGILSSIRKSISCKIKLIANSICLFWCNFASDHNNFLSHSSSVYAKSRYCRYYNHLCNGYRLDNLSELLKPGFIRPEDNKLYESLGFCDFVLESNSPSTDEMIKIVKAYVSRVFKGNLLEILSSGGEKPFQDEEGEIDRNAPRLENERLDGFLKHIAQYDDCYFWRCGIECRRCLDKTSTAVYYSDKALRKLKTKTQAYVNRIENGTY